MGTNVMQQGNQPLFCHIAQLIEQSRQRITTAVNTAMVYTYYEIGRYIVEDEQKGKHDAQYGKYVIKNLSQQLTDRFEEKWSVDTLKRCRFFYSVYSKKIGATVLAKSDSNSNNDEGNAVAPIQKMEKVFVQSPAFTLSWSHYLVLMRIENPDERSFYEIECQ
jgi:hypothetical protein